MKHTDYVKQLRAKTPEQLNDELAALRKEQFNLRLQYATGQLNRTHLADEVRKKIARVNTVLKQQAKAS
jgi:large subunit ribosomal protein L29